MNFRFYRLMTLLIVMIFTTVVYAVAPVWTIVQSGSKITFTGTQNNSPVSGEFKKFDGEIIGDIDQLNKSSVKLIIDINSLTISFKELEETLKEAEWFNVKLFPQAVFESNTITKSADGSYLATGKLTIRDKSIPLNINFTLDHYDQTKAKISGSTIVKRTAFNVGTGEWGSTDEVKDEVKVDFTLSAVKK